MKSTIHPNEIPSSRRWRGRKLPRHEEMMMFLDKTGPVRDTYESLCANLKGEGIDYVVIGAFALSAHNFERATTDVDVCLRSDDLEKFRARFLGREYQGVEGRARRFFDPQTGVTFDFLVSGSLAGRTSRNKVIRFPDPSEAVDIEGLRTTTLPRLIELKLVTWRFKDWADVVALIRANNLKEDFADQLDPLVRMAYLECYDQKVEEDRYEEEAGGF
jgi:hypothetical protein